MSQLGDRRRDERDLEVVDVERLVPAGRLHVEREREFASTLSNVAASITQAPLVTVVLPTTVWNVVGKVPRFRCRLTLSCVLTSPGASFAHSSTR